MQDERTEQIVISNDQIAMIHEELLNARSEAEATQRLEVWAQNLAESGERKDLGLLEQLSSRFFVSKLEYLQRLAKCRGCQFSTKVLEAGVSRPIILCKNCGCVMNIKARIKAANCPIGIF